MAAIWLIEWDVLQRALRHEKELRSVGTSPTSAGKESAEGNNGGKMSELQIQEELSTQFGDDVKDFLAEEAERSRKARRKNPQPAEWDFELLFQGWRWDLREQEAQPPSPMLRIALHPTDLLLQTPTLCWPVVVR